MRASVINFSLAAESRELKEAANDLDRSLDRRLSFAALQKLLRLARGPRETVLEWEPGPGIRYGMVERLKERGPGPWPFLSHGPFDFAILLIVNRARSWDLRLR